MPKKLPLILLIDDNTDDNYLHRRRIKKADAAERVEVCLDGKEALDFLKRMHATSEHDLPHPDLIFLDINMPLMNGWEFLDEYDKLPAEMKGNPVIIMLSTSPNHNDKERAMSYSVVQEYRVKPLSEDMLWAILTKYFP